MRASCLAWAALMIASSLPAQIQSDSVFPPLRASLVALSVADMRASETWYRQLGFREQARHTFNDGAMHIVFLERDGFRFELIQKRGSVTRQRVTPDTTENTSLQGLVKLAFDVSDFDRALTILRANAVRVAYGPRTDNGRRWIIVSDPDGNLVQLFEQRSR